MKWLGSILMVILMSAQVAHGACVRTTPSVALIPSMLRLYPGEREYIAGLVTNLDSPECGPSRFSYSFSYSGEGISAGVRATDSLVVAPFGGVFTLVGKVVVAPDATSEVGYQYLTLTATNLNSKKAALIRMPVIVEDTECQQSGCL